jgi:hypothetical protein
MAASVTLNHLDFLPYDEQAALEELLEKSFSETLVDHGKQGWCIDSSSAFVNHYPILSPIATGFINLCKNTYSVITLKNQRVNKGGNFCGHDPAKPRFVMQHHAYFAKQEIDDLGNKRRPQILYDIVERVKAYYDDPDVMPVLHFANADKRTSDHQRRSEFREAMVGLLSVMVMNMDLGSLRVGQPLAKGGFFNYGTEWLAKKADISLSRVKRAMSNLNNAMLITSYQYRELIDKEKKKYIAHNAARVFDMDFFEMLQIDLQKLGKARKMASQKQKDKQTAYQSTVSEKEQAVARLNMKKIMKVIDPQKGKLKSANLPEHEEEARKTKRLHKRRTEVFIELQADPYYRGNEEAFREALHCRLVEAGLLYEHELAP